MQVKVSLGIGPCPLGCGGTINVKLDDGLDDKSTASTLRMKARLIADAGGWRCGKCEYALPLTGDLLREIQRVVHEHAFPE